MGRRDRFYLGPRWDMDSGGGSDQSLAEPTGTLPVTVSTSEGSNSRPQSAGGGARSGPPPPPPPARGASAPQLTAPRTNADVKHYQRYDYARTRQINDRVAFMPLILGAFERASNGPHDCYLTTPITNFRLPEINYAEAQWQRRTWRETNRVRNALHRLQVEPYDALYKIGSDGKKKAEPFKAVLDAVDAVEGLLVDSLRTNAENIASSAANLRWMVVKTIRTGYKDLTLAARKDARVRLRQMIKNVFSERYRSYERLPFDLNSSENNEVWNGLNHATVFHRAAIISSDVEASKKAYLQMATSQEKMNINVAIISISEMRRIYKKLADSILVGEGQVNKFDVLHDVDKEFKKYSLEKAGLVGVPEKTSISSGTLMLDLQKVTGTFMWELLLERLEILWSNVFSYFSIITHDDELPSAAKTNEKGHPLSSAAKLTESFMDKAVPACMGHLFLALCPPFETDLMQFDQSKLDNFNEVQGYFVSMQAAFDSHSKTFISGIRVPEFKEFSETVGPSGYDALNRELKNAFFVDYVGLELKSTPNLQRLRIADIYHKLQYQWQQSIGQMDRIKIDRQFVNGTPEEHPLRSYPNKARDLICRTLLARMKITELSNDTVYNDVCKLLYVNYGMDGAFSVLIVNRSSHFNMVRKDRVVRGFYRSAFNPIALKSELGLYEKKDFPEETSFDLPAAALAKRIESKNKDGVDESYETLKTSHPLIELPKWIAGPLLYDPDHTATHAFDSTAPAIANLFTLKLNALGPLTRKATHQKTKPPPQSAHAPKSQPPAQQHQADAVNKKVQQANTHQAQQGAHPHHTAAQHHPRR